MASLLSDAKRADSGPGSQRSGINDSDSRKFVLELKAAYKETATETYAIVRSMFIGKEETVKYVHHLAQISH